MLTLAHKRRMQGSTMFIIDEKNYSNIFHALRYKQILEKGTVILNTVKITMNKAYLDRLDEFIKELPEGDLPNFVEESVENFSHAIKHPTIKGLYIFQNAVVYPLARKAFRFIWEEVEKMCQEIPRATDKVDITKEGQYELFDNLGRLNVSIPEFNCHYSGGGPE